MNKKTQKKPTAQKPIAKALATTVDVSIPAALKKQAGIIVEAANAEHLAKGEKNKVYAQVGAVIDKHAPALPLVAGNVNAQYSTFKEAHGTDRFSASDWRTARSFISTLRLDHEKNGREGVDFKTILLDVKRNCMNWEGTQKREKAIVRATKAKLVNPAGKQAAKPSRKKATAKTLTSAMFDEQLKTLIGIHTQITDKNQSGATPAFKKHWTQVQKALVKLEKVRTTYTASLSK